MWHVGLRIWLGHSIEYVPLSSYVSDSKVSNIAIPNLYVSLVKNTARISIHLLGFFFPFPGQVLDRGRPLADRGLAGLPRQSPHARRPRQGRELYSNH